MFFSSGAYLVSRKVFEAPSSLQPGILHPKMAPALPMLPRRSSDRPPDAWLVHHRAAVDALVLAGHAAFFYWFFLGQNGTRDEEEDDLPPVCPAHALPYSAQKSSSLGQP